MAVSAPLASHLLVTARTQGGQSPFLVEMGAVVAGMEMHA
jgi:hypothetical protein